MPDGPRKPDARPPNAGPLYDSLLRAFDHACGQVPPWDSDLEARVEGALTPLLAEGVRLRRQVEVPTSCGVFRLDWVLEPESDDAPETATVPYVALEADGPQHDFWRDLWRDALVLETGRVMEVIRFRASDWDKGSRLVLAGLAHHLRPCFSERARKSVLRAARPGQLYTDVRYNGHRIIPSLLRAPDRAPDADRDGDDLDEASERRRDPRGPGPEWASRPRTIDSVALARYQSGMLVRDDLTVSDLARFAAEHAGPLDDVIAAAARAGIEGPPPPPTEEELYAAYLQASGRRPA